MDDFAWLGLHTLIHDFDSFLSAMFTPLAQGTIRPLSERLFFVVGWHLFGLESPPFRAVVFATMFGCLALLSAITRRLTGSVLAGFLAPVLWMTNANLYMPMSWSSGYNQVLLAFCMLLALLLWIRYTETGERRYYVWQWIVFLLGFGVLELNVVYPAIAALHVLKPPGPQRIVGCRNAIPMFAVSAVYAVVHRMVAPPQQSETYRMYFDLGIVDTLRKYIQWSFGADRYAEYRGFSPIPFYICEAVAGLALLAFLIVMVRRKQWLALLAPVWFLVAISPVLPLKRHVSDYYLTIPVIGVAITAAWGLSVAWRKGTVFRILACVLLVIYIGPSAWAARGMSMQFHDESRRYSNFVRSVAYAHEQHPEKRLLMVGVDKPLFHGAWVDNPFRIFGLSKIYMPGSANGFGAPRHFMAETIALEGLKRGEVMAYEVRPDGRLRNITPLQRALWERTTLPLPNTLDIRDPLSEIQLVSGWWQAEANHRWMSRRAALRMAGPRAAGGELVVRGRAAGLVNLTTSINGVRLEPKPVAAGAFELRYPIAKAASLDIAFEVDRTIVVPGDGRALGVMFGTVEVTP